MNKLDEIENKFTEIFGEAHAVGDLDADGHLEMADVGVKLWNNVKDVFQDLTNELQESHAAIHELHIKSIDRTNQLNARCTAANESYQAMYKKYYDLLLDRMPAPKIVEIQDFNNRVENMNGSIKKVEKVVDIFPDLSNIQSISFNK